MNGYLNYENLYIKKIKKSEKQTKKISNLIFLILFNNSGVAFHFFLVVIP